MFGFLCFSYRVWGFFVQWHDFPGMKVVLFSWEKNPTNPTSYSFFNFSTTTDWEDSECMVKYFSHTWNLGRVSSQKEEHLQLLVYLPKMGLLLLGKSCLHQKRDEQIVNCLLVFCFQFFISFTFLLFRHDVKPFLQRVIVLSVSNLHLLFTHFCFWHCTLTNHTTEVDSEYLCLLLE